ncbi:kinase-like domain-containing protein, partial [Phascolomyces articulosus]
MSRSTSIESSSTSNDYSASATTTKMDHQILLDSLKEEEEEFKRKEKERETLSLKSKDGTPSSQFQLGNCIGKGQFGSVYKALDLATGEIVAVKRLQVGEDGMLDEEIMAKVELLRTLSHTNVISYLGFVRSKNHINIVLEYAENGSLMSTLKAFGAFPEKLVASFCVKLLNGLEYLHANSVVHCDLKAANILTTKTGDVKLSDFGVSLNLKIKENSDDGAISGTPNWMAPEVIELKGATPKSDIWSLGCTLVELATGKPPYANMIAMSAMFRIVEDDYPPLPDHMSIDMQDFLMQCFQKDPNNRPSASELKQHPWILSHKQQCPSLLSEQEPSCSSSAVSSSSFVSFPSTLSSSPSYAVNHPQQTSSSFSGGNTYSLPDSNNKKPIMPKDEPVIIENERNLQYPRIYYNIMPDDHEKMNMSERSHSSRRSTMDDGCSCTDESDSHHHHHHPGQHRFIVTSFGKSTGCKVCGGTINDQVTFCEACSLMCHEHCKSKAFSCPPKVNNQQPSYDWVFSAKIYNHQGERPSELKSSPSIEPEFARTLSCGSDSDHPQAASIAKYAQTLGLTPHEIKALSENPALLSHTIANMQQQQRGTTTSGSKGRTSRKNSGSQNNVP